MGYGREEMSRLAVEFWATGEDFDDIWLDDAWKIDVMIIVQYGDADGTIIVR